MFNTPFLRIKTVSRYLAVLLLCSYFYSHSGFCAVLGKKYYVAKTGSNNNPGSYEKPFFTIQKAADIVKPGDICYVRAGIYRETVRPLSSGLPNTPIIFEAYHNEKVILDGTNSVSGTWSLYKGNIFRIKVNNYFEQLFSDGKMMIEARWPNMSFPEQLWSRSGWATADEGSRYGKMVDSELAKTGIDWTGATAVLNVAHQFVTWTRVVKSHGAGSNMFTYEKNLNPITSYADSTKAWEDDLYYLTGKLEALDVPGEWYLDHEKRELYFWTPNGESPDKNKISFKFRDFAFDISDKEYISISGFQFFGTTINLKNVNYTLVEYCSFMYPCYSKNFNDSVENKLSTETIISGNRNIFRNNYLAYSQMSGIHVIGTNNLIDNNIIHDVAWNGNGCAIGIHSKKDANNTISGNTAYNTGYSVVQLNGGVTVKYNHFYNAALVSKDCAVIQSGNWELTGSVIHHNWIHDCYASGDHAGGLKGGLGIRGDDQTRGLTVHHNVVWNCGRDGIIVKGDSNKVFNNTVFNIGSNGNEGNYISLHTETEPYKPWRKQIPLLEIQNLNSLIINNAAFNVTGDRERNPYTPTKNMKSNYLSKEFKLKDPVNFDFSPRPGSPLIDSGFFIQGFTGKYNGTAPDIGAYEYGEAYWKAGANWIPEVSY